MYFEVGAASLEECRINTWTIIRFVNPVVYFLSDVLPLL